MLIYAILLSSVWIYYFYGLSSNIGHGLFVGWVESRRRRDWVSFLNPTYLPAIFVLSEKPNKMAEDRTIPTFTHRVKQEIRRDGRVVLLLESSSSILPGTLNAEPPNIV